MKKKNTLSSAEMYQLCKALEAADKPFTDWPQAVRILSAEIDRTLTRSNIETAAANCGFQLNDVVATPVRQNSYTKLVAQIGDLFDQVADMRRQINSLEARVNESERSIGDLDDVISEELTGKAARSYPDV